MQKEKLAKKRIPCAV